MFCVCFVLCCWLCSMLICCMIHVAMLHAAMVHGPGCHIACFHVACCMLLCCMQPCCMLPCCMLLPAKLPSCLPCCMSCQILANEHWLSNFDSEGSRATLEVVGVGFFNLDSSASYNYSGHVDSLASAVKSAVTLLAQAAGIRVAQLINLYGLCHFIGDVSGLSAGAASVSAPRWCIGAFPNDFDNTEKRSKWCATVASQCNYIAPVSMAQPIKSWATAVAQVCFCIA